MGIIEEVISEPVLEENEVVLTKRQIIDGFPPFIKQDNPTVIAEFIFEMQQAGNDMSWFNYDMLPDGFEEEEPKKKRKKKSSEADKTEKKKIAKKQKKDQKEKEIHLRSYSEASARGISESLTSSIHIPSQIDTTSSQIPSSTTINPTISQTSQLPPRHKSSQISTPIISTPIQTQTTPIITTTSESTHSESTQSDSIPTRQTTPLNVFNPSPSQSDSEVTLSNYSPTKSSDFIFPDPPSPSTENLSQLRIL
jgi:hypothetical protein